MQLVRSFIYALLFYAGTLAFCAIGLAAGLFGTGPMRAMVTAWARFNHWAVRHVLGIRIEVEGRIQPGPALIAVKHQSMFETVEMVLIADAPVIVLKRELTRIPLFGWITRCYGIIPVDREAGAKALREMLTLGRKAADARRPIIIYPEGTRVRPGETPDLRPGFAGLYRGLGVPVVPVAVNSGRLWGRGLVKQPGVIRFVIGDPIPAGLKREEVERRVHEAINVLEFLPAGAARGEGTVRRTVEG
ncbi:MAG: 1-acyl-sn-glycerol-3-phosphate acyltransferase [Sphingomicrobium sp.]